MRRFASWISAAVWIAGGVGIAAPVAFADAPQKWADAPKADPPKKEAPAWRVDDPTLVYLGNPRLFKKPCVVSADRVYRAIPEYREILEKNLTDKDVRYHFLMKKASDKFSRAIKDLSRDLTYDLVAGVGAVAPANKDTPAVPDETSSAVARLPAT